MSGRRALALTLLAFLIVAPLRAGLIGWDLGNQDQKEGKLSPKGLKPVVEKPGKDDGVESPVPEPATLGLFALGAGLAGLVARRRTKQPEA